MPAPSTRLHRAVEELRDRHPEVILHLRDHLLPSRDADTPRSALIAFAKVPARHGRSVLVVTAGTRWVTVGTVDWAVQVASFGRDGGRQRHTPVLAARAWAHAVVGDLWAAALTRGLDGPEWPWPHQLHRPAESFTVRHRSGIDGPTRTAA